jgi:hypothetical protein
MTETGATAWRCVNLELRIPYIFFTYQIQDAGGWVGQTSVLWRPDDIMNFCSTLLSDKSAKIVEVSMLAPEVHVENVGWEWYAIRELWSDTTSTSGVARPIYVLASGRVYDNGDTPGSVLPDDAKLLFHVPEAL